MSMVAVIMAVPMLMNSRLMNVTVGMPTAEEENKRNKKQKDRDDLDRTKRLTKQKD